MKSQAHDRRDARVGWVFALGLAALFLIGALLTIGDYGITWDEPENFMTGDLYWEFFRTGDRSLLDFEALKNQWALSEQKPPFYVYTFARQERYPPVANVVSAFTGWLLGDRLGWLGAIDAHHVAIPLFGALGVLVTCLFAWQSRAVRGTPGLAPGIVAGLGLALYPLYWGHSHNNVKDVPMAALFAATLWAGWRALGRPEGVNWRWVVITGLFWGLALGTKANALVILPVLLAWLVWLRLWPGIRRHRESHSWKTLFLVLACAAAIAGAVLLAVWPFLWNDPLQRTYEVWRYFASAGEAFPVFFEGQMYVAGETLPWRYALTHLILTAPLVVLALAGVGTVRAVIETWRGENSASALWLIWLGATLLRASLPGMVVYNGLRQIMEVLPVVCLMAGLGAEWLWKLVRSHRWPAADWIGVGSVALLVIPGALNLIRLHPYEGAFFNTLAGGESRASQNYTLEYWGQSYKDGGEWLNSHAGEGAWVAVPIAGHLARFSLRPDLALISTDQVSDLADIVGEGYVMVMHNRDRYGGPNQLPRYCERECTRLHTIEADGAVLLSIYAWPGHGDAKQSAASGRCKGVCRQHESDINLAMADLSSQEARS